MTKVGSRKVAVAPLACIYVNRTYAVAHMSDDVISHGVHLGKRSPTPISRLQRR